MNSAKELKPLPDLSPDTFELSMKNFRLLINERTVLGAENPVRGGVLDQSSGFICQTAGALSSRLRLMKDTISRR
jgi:hypothetical protein